MKLKEFVSLNLLSLSAYVNLLFCLYVFYIQSIFPTIPKALYVTLEEASTVYSYYLIFIITLIVLFIVEFFIRKKFDFSNKELFLNDKIKVAYSFLFYVGLVFVLLFTLSYIGLLMIF